MFEKKCETEAIVGWDGGVVETTTLFCCLVLAIILSKFLTRESFAGAGVGTTKPGIEANRVVGAGVGDGCWVIAGVWRVEGGGGMFGLIAGLTQCPPEMVPLSPALI